MTQQPSIGDRIELEITGIAHGGHCVARHDGRVIFVRHTLPGERVIARLSDAGKSKFWRADAVEILQASPDRVPSAWPEAGADGVGGGELAHVSLDGQRRWKSFVIEDQLKRIGGIDRGVNVAALPGESERGGLGYRTRVELVAGRDGRAGMRQHRSHDVVALKSMPLATDAVAELLYREAVWGQTWRPGTVIEAVVPGSAGAGAGSVAGEGAEGSAAGTATAAGVLLVDGKPWHRGGLDHRANARNSVTETVTVGDNTWTYKVAAAGFWQVHVEASSMLVEKVLAAVGDVSGAQVWDLYSGAGLFSVPLANATGDSGAVTSVEGSVRAVKDARRNSHHLKNLTLHTGDVAATLREQAEFSGADVVVLDPPRVGAGAEVIDAIAASNAKRVVYVACDPAALARDLKTLVAHGFALESLDGFDLFPMTHHVECVATLTR